MTTVTASVVLYNSAGDIEACLRALGRQSRSPDHIVVFDNASTDGGLERARSVLPEVNALRSTANIGFAAGHNRAIEVIPADIHLVLNPDCQLGPGFLAAAVSTLERDSAVGAVSGRLLRFRQDTEEQPLTELDDDVLDSTGMIGFRNRRVLDRDGDQPAGGRRLVPEYVFGASGAAAVYRRAMLEDVAFEGEMFDEDFFTYREDVDLAWRAQHLGWKTMYVPSAVARHRRRVAPGRRRQLPSEINRRSVANRWRMILKNETAIGCRADGLAILARDLLTLGYCTLRERQTLGAIADVLVSTPRIQSWRNDIMRRRRAPAEETLAWFGRQASLPLIEANGDRIHS